MNKRIFSIFCILAVVLVFALTAQTVSLSFDVGAEDTVSSTKKPAQEEPYVEPSTSATTTTQPPMPTTASTTKPEETTTKPTESSTNPTNPTNPTTKPTESTPVSETSPSSTHSSSEKESETGDHTTTTKKGGKTTTTTKKFVYTTAKRTAPHMTIPQVDNTTVEGTTLSPLDAYFERISGDSNTFTTEAYFEQTQPTEPEEMEEPKQLSTIAIVAICLGGIALVTVALTAGFAIRNKRADDTEDEAADYEQDAYGTDEYVETKPEPKQQARPQVDESDSFTVVSLDDKDYKD